jgi:hypothetical protein
MGGEHGMELQSLSNGSFSLHFTLIQAFADWIMVCNSGVQAKTSRVSVDGGSYFGQN